MIALTAPATRTKWKWATTKYVSVSCQSTGKMARITPVTPPITNRAMNPAAQYNGVFITSVPRHSVAIQLNTFTPVGTAITTELSMKKASTTVDTGVANMWCAHTSSDRKAIATLEAATAL